jgi:hypothetical protein
MAWPAPDHSTRPSKASRLTGTFGSHVHVQGEALAGEAEPSAPVARDRPRRGERDRAHVALCGVAHEIARRGRVHLRAVAQPGDVDLDRDLAFGIQAKGPSDVEQEQESRALRGVSFEPQPAARDPHPGGDARTGSLALGAGHGGLFEVDVRGGGGDREQARDDMRSEDQGEASRL